MLSASAIEWLSSLRNMLITMTIDTISGAVSSIALFFVSLVFAFYFMMNMELLRHDGYRIFGRRIRPETGRKMKRIASTVSLSFTRFAVAQVLEAVIIGSICFVGMLIFIFILQQFEGDFIYPRVVGTSTGLPPIYVFAAVTLGGILFGLAGMILAVPVVSAAYALISSEYESTTGSDTEANGSPAAED